MFAVYACVLCHMHGCVCCVCCVGMIVFNVLVPAAHRAHEVVDDLETFGLLDAINVHGTCNILKVAGLLLLRRLRGQRQASYLLRLDPHNLADVIELELM